MSLGVCRCQTRYEIDTGLFIEEVTDLSTPLFPVKSEPHRRFIIITLVVWFTFSRRGVFSILSRTYVTALISRCCDSVKL